MNKYSIASLYSGSKGNCVLIETEKAKILIDAGKSARALCQALGSVGLDFSNIDAIFITHEHTDHVSALEVLLKKHQKPVHIVGISAQKLLLRSAGNIESSLCIHPPKFSVEVGDMTVESFPTPHDSEFSVGYRIAVGDTCIGYATDIGYVTDEIRENLSGCESVVLECNHDVDMLMNGAYPYDLKLRIRSNRGHLSNRDCADLAADLCLIGTKNILLAHLSEENNDPTLAYDEVWSAISDDSVNLKIASQYEPIKLI